MRGQIRLRRRGADVRKLEALLKVGGSDQNSMGHTLSQLNNPRGRRKPGDSAAPKGACPFRSTSDLQYRNIFDGFKAQSFNQNPRGDIRRTAHAADSNALAS